jgi:hypothetical protein
LGEIEMKIMGKWKNGEMREESKLYGIKVINQLSNYSINPIKK